MVCSRLLLFPFCRSPSQENVLGQVRVYSTHTWLAEVGGWSPGAIEFYSLTAGYEAYMETGIIENLQV